MTHINVEASEDFKRKAERNYMLFWRLIYEGGLSVKDVFALTFGEIYEANFALDIFLKRKNGGESNSNTS